MVELGRFVQIEALKAKGWTTDEETALFHAMDAREQVIGGCTYLRSPDGRIHACSGGMERPVDGEYALVSINGDPRYTSYKDGRAEWSQG